MVYIYNVNLVFKSGSITHVVSKANNYWFSTHYNCSEKVNQSYKALVFIVSGTDTQTDLFKNLLTFMLMLLKIAFLINPYYYVLPYLMIVFCNFSFHHMYSKHNLTLSSSYCNIPQYHGLWEQGEIMYVILQSHITCY